MMDVRIYGSNDCENGSAEEAGDWAVLWRFGGDSKASTSDSADPSSTASENCIRMIDSSAVEAALLGGQWESCSGLSSSEARPSKRSCGAAAAALLANSGHCCTGNVSSAPGGSTSVATARLVAVWTLGGVGCCDGLVALMVFA